MTGEDVLEILDRLDAAAVVWWIDGGWGVDALLGQETRPHDDLDFAVQAEDVERLPAIFPEFRHVDEDQLPSAYVLRDGRGRQLDFHPLDFDDQGNGWQPQAEGGRFRWPREALGARGQIGGREVRCTSPEFQVESHLYEGYDDVDWQAVATLCERFGLSLPAGGPPGFVHERRGRRPAGDPMTEEQIRAATVGELKPRSGPLVLQDYDPDWPRRFERDADRIRAALGERALQIEHIGSTSVPGLAAKPIIDMMLVVEESADEDAYVPALEQAGYVLVIREPDWYEHRVFKGPDTDVNLHTLSRGCPEIDRVLLFRDRLRENDRDRALYERTKRELAAKDWKFVQNYADAKTAVIEEIIARARQSLAAAGE